MICFKFEMIGRDQVPVPVSLEEEEVVEEVSVPKRYLSRNQKQKWRLHREVLPEAYLL